MSGFRQKSGRPSLRSSTRAPGVVLSTIALWAAVLGISASRSTRVSSVGMPTLGMATTEQLMPARRRSAPHLLAFGHASRR